MDKKKKTPFPKKAALAMAFLAAAVPFAHQVMPEFNGTQSNAVWEQTARNAIKPEMDHRAKVEHRQNTEVPKLKEIKTPLDGTQGAFAKKEITFVIDGSTGKGTEIVNVIVTQVKGHGPLKVDDVRFSENFYPDHGLPANWKPSVPFPQFGPRGEPIG